MHRQAARSRCPFVAPLVAKSGQFLPCRRTVGGTEDCGIFNSGEDSIDIRERRFEVPDSFEFKRMRRSVVPHMCAWVAFVDKLVTDSRWCPGEIGRGFTARLFPRPATVAGTLDDLPEPVAALRCINPVRIDGGPLQMVHRPASKKRARDIPCFAFSIRSQDKCTLRRTNEYSYPAHYFDFLSSCR